MEVSGGREGGWGGEAVLSAFGGEGGDGRGGGAVLGEGGGVEGRWGCGMRGSVGLFMVCIIVR